MTDQPERFIENNVLTSTALPRITLKIADDLHYLGRVKFNLYGVACVDLFIFVSAPTGKRRTTSPYPRDRDANPINGILSADRDPNCRPGMAPSS